MPELQRSEIRGVRSKDRSDAAGAKLGLWASLIGLVVLTAWALNTKNTTPDRHFVEAERQLARYEDSKHPDNRDYSLPLYAEVVEMLALVDPDSVSAPAASALLGNLKAHIGEMEAHAEEGRARLETQRQRHQRNMANGELAVEWNRYVSAGEQEEDEYDEDLD